MSATGWKLDPTERAQLLRRFAPHWPDTIADHVTLKGDAAGNEPFPQAQNAEIVGTVDDGLGLQAMIVAIEGTTDRPDVSTYHITWSIDRQRGRKGADSNEVIARLGWQPLDRPVPIRLRPARF